MKLIFARIYQKILYVATNLMKFRTPTILYNILDIKEVLKNKNFKNVLLLSGKRVCKEEFYIRLDESLKDELLWVIDYDWYVKRAWKGIEEFRKNYEQLTLF